ncbi:hypothetical protein M9Y10_030716 [Tritrichomonas musculus]|uniref:Surface antigen BspA-like n=1 Tax=Tritrichomonas musculus TaxID=1915356 RepID=A0ABR2H2S2_9EUKA
MQEAKSFDLIMNNKVFVIPVIFPTLYNVNPNILHILNTKKIYKVKSKVSENVFQSFIDHWTTGKIPDFQQKNIIEYELLSSEFERMEDIIDIYKNNYISNVRLLANQKSYNLQIEKKNSTIKQYNINISYLFTYNKVGSLFENDQIKDQILSACIKGNSKFISLNCRKKLKENGLIFVLNEETKEAGIIGHDDSQEKYFIPKTIRHGNDDYRVTIIFENSFSKSQKVKLIEFPEDSEIRLIENSAFSHSSIKSITIPSNVKKIGKEAFRNCTKLLNVYFTDDSKLETIEESVFTSSSIEEITIPATVKTVSKHTFLYCINLKNIIFSHHKSELKTIESNAFFNCSVESISIPSSVEELKDGWCCGMRNLKEISITESDTKNIIYYDNKFIIGRSNPKSDIFDVLYFVRRDIQNATIPSFIKKIAPYSFESCSKLKNVDFLEDSELEVIGYSSFSPSTIETITIPKHVKCIGESAFNSCSRLKHINFHKNSELEEIGTRSFSASSVKSITFPQLIKIGSYAFSDCTQLKNVAVESKLQSIGNSAFKDSTLKSLSIPSSASQFEYEWCDRTYELNDITIIECDEKNIIYYDDKFIIGKSNLGSDIYDVLLFARRDIENVTIPSFITRISPYSFNFCSKLKNVDFLKDSKIQCIDKNSFTYSSIERVFIPKNLKEIENNSFVSCKKLREIEFEENSKLKIIKDYAFGFTSIEKISFPSSLRIIKFHTFSGCPQLKTVEFPCDSELRVIGKSVFTNCPLEYLTIPSSVRKFESDWCFRTLKLNNIKIHECYSRNISYYDDKFIIMKTDIKSDNYDILLFARRDIKNVIIPSFIKYFANYSFNYCLQIKTVEFEKNSQLSAINNFAFSESSIESITIPSSVTEIKPYSFYSCKNLKFIQFHYDSQLKIIGEYAFAFSKLASFAVPSKVVKIDNFAFADCKILQIVEIDEYSEIKSFGKNPFHSTKLDAIMVPNKLIKSFFYSSQSFFEKK